MESNEKAVQTRRMIMRTTKIPIPEKNDGMMYRKTTLNRAKQFRPTEKSSIDKP